MEIWKKVNTWLGMLAKQRHLIALRDGMIAAVPIILVGSTFLLLGSQKDVIIKYLPALSKSTFGVWYENNYQSILLPFRFTMGMLSVYVAFTIAASLASQYKLPVLPQGLGAVVAFMVTIEPYKVALKEGGKAVWVLPMSQLGGEGLFLGILCGLFTVEMSRAITYLWNRVFNRNNDKKTTEQSVKEAEASDKKPAKTTESLSENVESTENITSTTSQNGSDEAKNSSASRKDEPEVNNEGIPKAVSDAFASFVPLLTVVTIVWITCHTFNIDIYQGLITLMKPLEKLGDSSGCVIIVNFFLHILGVAGIHGISVMNGVFFALWQKFLLLNTEAHATGAALPYITAYPFYQWFVWIGGAGTTLPVPFLLLFFRNPHMKRIGKISLIPSLFNVNEPLLFGLPVVANPLLAVPFILAPIVSGCIAFYSFSLGFVTKPFIEVPWVLPAILGAPLCTQDPRALILLGANIFISAIIWLPFLKAYEKKISLPERE